MKEISVKKSVFDKLSHKIEILENHIHDKAAVADGLLDKLANFKQTSAGEKVPGLEDMELDVKYGKEKIEEKTSKLKEIATKILKENSSGQGLRDFAQKIDQELLDLETELNGIIKERLTDNDTKLSGYINSNKNNN